MKRYGLYDSNPRPRKRTRVGMSPQEYEYQLQLLREQYMNNYVPDIQVNFNMCNLCSNRICDMNIRTHCNRIYHTNCLQTFQNTMNVMCCPYCQSQRYYYDHDFDDFDNSDDDDLWNISGDLDESGLWDSFE